MDRLTGAASELYEAQSFAYNAIDNMTANCGRTYLYESGRPHAVTSDGTYSYTYDANGNMASRSGGRSFSYDYDNRVSSVSDGGSYAYDASGGRVKKVEGGVTTYYFFPGYQEEWGEGAQAAKVVRYYFAEKLRVAQRNEENGLLYLHTDHLGSSVRMSSGNAGSEGEVVRALGVLAAGRVAYFAFALLPRVIVSSMLWSRCYGVLSVLWRTGRSVFRTMGTSS